MGSYEVGKGRTKIGSTIQVQGIGKMGDGRYSPTKSDYIGGIIGWVEIILERKE